MIKLIPIKKLKCRQANCNECPFACNNNVYLRSLCHEIKLNDNLFDALTNLSEKMNDEERKRIEKKLNKIVMVHEYE